MSNTEFKKAFDDVSPDMFMETRILAGVKEKRKKHFPLKAVISGALALVVAVTCIGGIHYKTTYTDRPFSVMIVSASDDVLTTEEISDDAVRLPIMQISYEEESVSSYNTQTGETQLTPSVSTTDECGLSVTGDDIDYVQYECKNDDLSYFNVLKVYYDIENQNYYTVIIPVPDNRLEEVKNIINEYSINPEEQALKRYAETYDISQHFGNKNTDLDEYQVQFEKCSDIGYPQNNDGYAFYLVENEWAEEYTQDTLSSNQSEVTVKNYELSDTTLKHFTDEEIREMYSVYYYPHRAADALLENPDMKKSELPGDEITVTVTFKDGKKARKVITVSFDDEGYAQFSLK